MFTVLMNLIKQGFIDGKFVDFIKAAISKK